MNRQAFLAEHPGLFLLDVADAPGLARYLANRGVLGDGEALVQVAKAGAGNMNCTVRATLGQRTLIVKQARPWVEKYDHIAAPWNRSHVEAAFYVVAASEPALARQMPRLLHADADSRVIVLEDIGGSDLTSLYRGAVLADEDCRALVAYLATLHCVTVPARDRTLLANREMRALNHDHMFHVPLMPANGLALDEITPGLQSLADDLKGDHEYVGRVAALGSIYLADGAHLVHGDFFPGSWLRSTRGIVVIDPEFCFIGRGEFDFGVMIAHVLFARQPEPLVRAVLRALPDTYNGGLTRQFAGVEIMRRLIGVAQLPLQLTLDQKSGLLTQSRQLVLGEWP